MELAVQFKNEYGASISSKESRWEVRRAAGLVLGRDMTTEMRARAEEILHSLKAEAAKLSEPDRLSMDGYATPGERGVLRGLDGLGDLGLAIRGLVESEAETASGDHAGILDMAKARLGDRESLGRVIILLTEASTPSIRFCSAQTLRRIKVPQAKPALWKAPQDPYRRWSGRSGQIHPVRVVAADALVELGEDFRRVRAAMSQLDAKKAQPDASPNGGPATPPGNSDGSAESRHR